MNTTSRNRSLNVQAGACWDDELPPADCHIIGAPLLRRILGLLGIAGLIGAAIYFGR